MGQWYSKSTNREKDTVAIIHIYGARGIFLLFNDDQDTLSTYCEIEMSISQLIFTHKSTSKVLW